MLKLGVGRCGGAARTFALRPLADAVAVAVLSFVATGAGVTSAQLPSGPRITAGAATVQQPNAKTLVVDQGTARAVLDWTSFSIGQSNAVVFNQPSASSVALNRVTGSDPSRIFGSLQANGHIFLTNPNGILFARGASVDVGGLVASTLGISTPDFMAGRYAFTGGATAGTVVNKGDMRAADGGYVALLGREVSNSGTIAANRGSVALGAGDKMLLDFDGDGLLTFTVDLPAASARISHTGLIHADGGRVLMTAGAKNALLSTVINMDGIVRARGISERNGEIRLDGGASGVVSVTGTLDASSDRSGRRGGNIRVLGEHVGLFDNATLDVTGRAGGGSALVGGDFQGGNPGIPNARETIVSRGARILADGTEQGNGGKVIVWSDDTTKFFGRISARGGPEGGDGGFVEVSGKSLLAFRGAVDTSAPRGNTGILLLDPDTLTIRGGNADGDLNGSNTSFSGSGGAGTIHYNDVHTTIYESEIEEQSKTANIVLQAARTIRVDNSEFNYNSGNPGDASTGVLALAANRTLTLETRNGPSESGSIDLVSGGFHGANLKVVTSGTGSIVVVSGTANSSPGPAAPITLPRLISGTGGVNVSAAQQGGDITFAGSLDGAGDVVVTTPGKTTFAGPVGAVTPPASLTTDGGGATVINGGSVTTTGRQSYMDDVRLGANTTLTGQSSSFWSGVNGAGFDLALDLSAGTGIRPDLTGIRNLSTGNGGTTSIIGEVTTSGTQTYNNDVLIALGATLVSTGAGSSGNITFGGRLGGASSLGNPPRRYPLTVNTAGTTTFGGRWGRPLLTVTTDAPGTTVISTPEVLTTGAQTYNDPVILGADVTLTSFGAGAEGNITFGSRIDSADYPPRSLTVNTAGTTTFGGHVGVGNAARLLSLTTDAPGTTVINTSNIYTAREQTYNDPVTLGTDTELFSLDTGANITFAGALDGPFALRVGTFHGTTTFGGAVGGTTPLASLKTRAGGDPFAEGTTAINGGSITTTGAQEYNEAVILGANTTLTSSGGDITFASAGAKTSSRFIVHTPGAAINADSVANNRRLTISSQNGAVILGSVGHTHLGAATVEPEHHTMNADISPQPLGGLTVVANQLTLTGDLRLNGGGAVDFRNVREVLFQPSTLLIDTGGGSASTGTRAAGAILFGDTGTLNPATAGSDLTLDAIAEGAASGRINLGTVGNLVPLGVLTLRGYPIHMNGPVTAQQTLITSDPGSTGPASEDDARRLAELSDARAAALAQGLSTPGTFASANNPLGATATGLLFAPQNPVRSAPLVEGGGKPSGPPLFEFVSSGSRRTVCYSGSCSGDHGR